MALSSSLRRISCHLVKQSSTVARAQHAQPGHLLRRGFHTTSCRLNEHIINIQDEDDFKDRVLKNAKPVIVDFHAVWCGPCKLLGPRLESLIASKAGSVLMAKVDIDENSDLALDHGVEAVPTVLAVKDGKVVDKFIGLKDDTELRSFVNKLTGE